MRERSGIREREREREERERDERERERDEREREGGCKYRPSKSIEILLL